jgi:hypothetical protein
MPLVVRSPADKRSRGSGTTVSDVSGQSPDFGGMTVNERLVTAGLFGQFDTAIAARDRHLAIEVLKQVAMSADSAAATVDAVLADPSHYGFPRPS